MNDASCDLSVLLGVNSYVLGGSKFLRKFGQEHFQQDWKVEILIVGPDLYSVVTMLVRSDVSWSFHVESLPLLLKEVSLMPGR